MTKTKRKDNGAARKEFTSSPPTTLSVVGPRLYTNRKDKMTKQKHTPGTDCGCEPDGVFVNLCPLHAAAPELLEALEKTLEILTTLIVKERTQ